MAVYAFTAGDGEQPGRESATAIELADALERFHKCVLRRFAGIGRVAAELAGKSKDAMFEAVNYLFESIKRAGLCFAGQLFVRNRCKVLAQF